MPETSEYRRYRRAAQEGHLRRQERLEERHTLCLREPAAKILLYWPGNRKSMPRSVLALVVAGISNSTMGILRARC